MVGKSQFSLKYLLAEVLWFAAAMGLTRFLVTSNIDSMSYFFNVPNYFTILAMLTSIVAAAGFWGAAIGGLFGRMKLGARLTTYAMLLFLTLSILNIISPL